MKNSTLLFLALALVIAAVTSVLLTKDNTSQTIDVQSLLGEFEEQITDIQSLEIRNHDSVLFSAQKLDNEWYATHIAPQSRFPVNFDALSDFISSLNEADLMEAKTQTAENYARLGVEDLVVENAQSLLLTLESSNANFELLIGNASSNGLGSFVRSPSSKQSWQLDRVLSLPTEQYSWLKNPVLDVEQGNVLRAEMVGENGWVIEKTQEQGYQLAGLNETENLTYPTVLANTLSSILSVTFDSATLKTNIDLPESPEAELFFETNNGPLIIRVFTKDENHWVTYDYAQQAWLGDWALGVSSFGQGQLVKSRSDLVETPEVSEESEQPQN